MRNYTRVKSRLLQIEKGVRGATILHSSISLKSTRKRIDLPEEKKGLSPAKQPNDYHHWSAI